MTFDAAPGDEPFDEAVDGEPGPETMPGWDEILAAFDKADFKAGDVVSDAWISHNMRITAPNDLAMGLTPREAISARDRWQRACTALVEKVRSSRKMHMTSVLDGYVILDDRAVGDHEMRKFANALVAHSERTAGRLDLIRTEALSTEERDRLVRQKQALALFQRTSLPRMRKVISAGEPPKR